MRETKEQTIIRLKRILDNTKIELNSVKKLYREEKKLRKKREKSLKYYKEQNLSLKGTNNTEKNNRVLTPSSILETRNLIRSLKEESSNISKTILPKKEQPIKQKFIPEPITYPFDQKSSLPDYSTLTGKWYDFLDDINPPRLKDALQRDSFINIIEENNRIIFTFYVKNQEQKDWIIKNRLKQFEEQFRRIMNCSRIDLRVEIMPNNNYL